MILLLEIVKFFIFLNVLEFKLMHLEKLKLMKMKKNILLKKLKKIKILVNKLLIILNLVLNNFLMEKKKYDKIII